MADVLLDSYYDKNGKRLWRYRFEIASVDGNRKWKSKRGFRTKSEAQKAGKEAQAQYERKGEVIEPSPMSYDDLCKKWLDAAGLKETSRNNYEKRIRLYISPKIGNRRIKSIKREDLRHVLEDAINEGLSKISVAAIKSILVKSFEFAVDEKHLLESPAVGLKTPKIERPNKQPRSSPRTALTQAEIDKIFVRFPPGHPSHIPLLLGYSCGLRRSEAFAVTWDNIDFDAQTLTVDKQIQWHKDETRTEEEKRQQNGNAVVGDGFWYFSTPKYGSTRTIAMSDKLTEELRAEKKKQDSMREYYGDYYFHYFVNERKEINQNQDGKEIFFLTVREAGDYITSRTLQHTSYVIQHELGIASFNFHSLRHTHASMLAEMGAPASYVSSRLGHKNLSTTLNIYYHLTDKQDETGNKFLNQRF